MSSRCPRCGAATARRTLPGLEHRDGPVRASSEPRSLLSCADRCGSDIAEATRRAIDAQLVIATRRVRGRSSGAWRRLLPSGRTPGQMADRTTDRTIDRCGGCATALDLPLRATTRALTIEPADGDPFTITLGLPLGRCPSCGCDNVPSALAGAVAVAALTAARAPLSQRRRRVGWGSPGTA